MSIEYYVLGGFFLGAFLSWLVCRHLWVRKIEKLRVQVAELNAYKQSSEEKVEWIRASQQQMEQAFQALAGKVFQQNSEEFLKRLSDNINMTFEKVKSDWNLQKMEIKSLVDPLKDNLASLDGYVRELEKKREGAYKGLQEQITHLSQLSTNLYKTTITLAQALRSSSIRGRWGEIQLKRVVELAGMVKHISFEEQVASDDRGRPDMIIYLPNGGILPVDSKVPLNSYLEGVEAKDETLKNAKFLEHAKAVRNRIKELGNKRYWQQFEKSPEFVVMFVPNEQCLSVAFEADPQLIDFGIEQKVLIATPVTLLALLKAVAYGWQQVSLAENASKIANQAKDLYDKFGVFLNHLVGLGKNINSTVESYNRAVGSLDYRVLPSFRRLKDLGVTTSELAQMKSVDIRPRLPKVEKKGV